MSLNLSRSQTNSVSGRRPRTARLNSASSWFIMWRRLYAPVSGSRIDCSSNCAVNSSRRPINSAFPYAIAFSDAVGDQHESTEIHKIRIPPQQLPRLAEKGAGAREEKHEQSGDQRQDHGTPAPEVDGRSRSQRGESQGDRDAEAPRHGRRVRKEVCAGESRRRKRSEPNPSGLAERSAGSRPVADAATQLRPSDCERRGGRELRDPQRIHRAKPVQCRNGVEGRRENLPERGLSREQGRLREESRFQAADRRMRGASRFFTQRLSQQERQRGDGEEKEILVERLTEDHAGERRGAKDRAQRRR